MVRSHRKSSRQISDLQKLEPASPRRTEKMKLEIDQQRLLSEIEALAAISDAERPAVTRIVFTPTALTARAWMITHCEEARLAVRQDTIGTIFSRWVGGYQAGPPVGHDSPNAPLPTTIIY